MGELHVWKACLWIVFVTIAGHTEVNKKKSYARCFIRRKLPALTMHSIVLSNTTNMGIDTFAAMCSVLGLNATDESQLQRTLTLSSSLDIDKSAHGT